MSFLSDLFSGNTGNLGNDLSPSSIFSDTTQDIGGKYTIPELVGGAGLALGGLGLVGGLGGLGALGGAAEAGAAGAPLDLLAGGTAAGTAGGTALGSFGAIGDYSGLTAGLATEPGFAGSVAGDSAAAFGGTDLAGLAPPTLAPGVTDSATLPGLSSPNAASGADAFTAPGYNQLTTPWSQGGPGPVGGPSPAGLSGAGGADAATGGAGLSGAAPAGSTPVDLSQTANTLSNISQTGVNGALPQSQNILTQLGNFLNTPTAKAVSALVSAGGLGYNLYNQNKTAKADQAQITNAQNQANQIAQQQQQAAQPTLQQGQLLTSYLTTGTLPAPIQAQLDQATAAAKASAIANAGAQGLSTDPSTNTALSQQLANIDQQALANKGTLEGQLQTAGTQMITQANQMIAMGLSATEMSAQLQEYLIGVDNQLSQQTGQAITNFAAALGGGTTNKGIALSQNSSGQLVFGNA